MTKNNFQTQEVPATRLVIEPLHRGSSSILLISFLGHPVAVKPGCVGIFEAKLCIP